MWGFLAAVCLVAVNAFFVAAEFALVRVRPTRFERLKKKSTTAAVVLKILKNLERYLSVSQIGITLASLALGWIGEPAVAWLIERAYSSLSGKPLGHTVHGVSVGIAFGLITYMHVLLGEQVPKMIALHRAETVALALARPMLIAYYVLLPALFLLEGATRILLKIFGIRNELSSEGKLSEEELLGIIGATLGRGPGTEDKRQLVERVIRFASREARHAMIPRVDIAYLSTATKGDTALKYLHAQGYTRVVLCEQNDLDRVVGYLYAKDLFLRPDAEALPDLRPLRRDILFVPETQSLIDILRTMQASQTLFAIVVDEFGGTSGLLTMEDLVEEIVGEIRDEADEEAIPNIREIVTPSGVYYEVAAMTLLEELRAIGLELENEDETESFGAYILRRLGRLPRRSDRIRVGHFDVEIRIMRRRRIELLRLTPRTSERFERSEKIEDQEGPRSHTHTNNLPT